MRPVSFKWENSGNNDYGLIAEEVHSILPDIVPLDKDGLPFSVRYQSIIPFLIKKIQEMDERIKVLEYNA